MTDTYAVDLCNTDGSPATKDSDGYLFHGTCTPMEKLVRKNAWSPTVADGTKAGSYKLVAHRTAYGVVRYRATIDGDPVAYTTLRSTYRHEVETLIGFQMFNDPEAVTGPESFSRRPRPGSATRSTGSTPTPGTPPTTTPASTRPAARAWTPNLPIRAGASTEWRDWDPETNTVPNTPDAEHPQDIDQDYYESWNNKIAKGYTVAGFGDGPVYRSNLLDRRIKSLISDGGKVSRASLTRAMEDAAVTDLRGEAVLPELLKVIGTGKVTDPELKEAVDGLRGWLEDGAQRKETGPGTRTYAHADAIRTMDAWWPLLVEEDESPPRPGAGSLRRSDGRPADRRDALHPGRRGGAQGLVLPARLVVLCAQGPAQGARRTGAGGGAEDVLRRGRRGAVPARPAEHPGGGRAHPPAKSTYPGDDVCEAGDQWCADSIQQRPLGGITDDLTNWQNRPTYQQVVQFPAHR
ncbi:penicillin acylase family protein [Streptomyces sp. GKU 257-1]|nr:penicillin acylase family protein [Streptomyces sp. GKU 257-1]